MNKTRQFLALVKFQMASNPFVLAMPLAIAAPYYIPFFTGSGRHDYHPGLDMLLSEQNIWLVGFVGLMLLAPEVVRFGAANAMWATGTEFLLTRAVDRHLVLRSRSALFYFLILAIPVIAMIAAFKSPGIQIDEYNKVAHQQVLERLPGSAAMPGDDSGRSVAITIPNGNLVVQSWSLWLFVCNAIGIQLFLYLIYPLKYRSIILWVAYIGCIFLPLAMLGNLVHGAESLSAKERVFFAFAPHQLLFWAVTISALLLGQLWCERRFSKFEQ